MAKSKSCLEEKGEHACDRHHPTAAGRMASQTVKDHPPAHGCKVDSGTGAARRGLACRVDADLLMEALDSIDEAVAVYDADDRLVAFNAPYAHVRSAIGGEVTLGVRWDDLVAASVRAGRIPEAVGREEEWLRRRRLMRGSYSIIRRVPGGRSFQVNERRMPSRGIAVVWTDITDLVDARDRLEAALHEAEVANARLSAEMVERRRAEEELAEMNASLEQRVAERTADLQKTIRQRDLLLREVYHRVKNNMQVVNSLIAIQMSSSSKTSPEEFLKDLQYRVTALGLVHQQLMTSDDLSTFDICLFLEELKKNLSASAAADGRDIAFAVQADVLHVDLDFAIPFGLLVVELVSNALKHAFMQRPDGTVEIGLHRVANDTLVLTVADNGDSLVRDRGASIGRRGSAIVDALIAQLEGEMVASRAGGTTVEICMPLPGRRS